MGPLGGLDGEADEKRDVESVEHDVVGMTERQQQILHFVQRQATTKATAEARILRFVQDGIWQQKTPGGWPGVLVWCGVGWVGYISITTGMTMGRRPVAFWM